MRMKYKLIGFIIILIGIISNCEAVSCYISTCQDIRGLSGSCPTVYLNKTLTNTVNSEFCITMGSQIFDMNGYTINMPVSATNYEHGINIFGSGEVKNGVLNCYSSGSSGYRCSIINTNSQTASIVFRNLTITSTASGNNYGIIYINTPSTISTVYFYDSVISSGNSFRGIDLRNNLYLSNSNFSYTNGLYGMITVNSNNINITLYSSQIFNSIRGILNNGYNNTKLNIYSARICSNTNDLYFTVNPNQTTINNLGNEFYYDILSGNYTLSGNNKRDCYEFQGYFDNITEIMMSYNQSIILMNITINNLINQLNNLSYNLSEYINNTNITLNNLIQCCQDNTNNINSVNISLTADLNNTNNSLTAYLNNLTVSLNNTNNTVNALNISLTADLNNLTVSLNNLNNSLTADLNNLTVSLNNLNNSLTADLNNLTVSLNNLNNSLTADLNNLTVSLNDLNISLTANLTVIYSNISEIKINISQLFNNTVKINISDLNLSTLNMFDVLDLRVNLIYCLLLCFLLLAYIVFKITVKILRILFIKS